MMQVAGPVYPGCSSRDRCQRVLDLPGTYQPESTTHAAWAHVGRTALATASSSRCATSARCPTEERSGAPSGSDAIALLVAPVSQP